MKLEIFIIIIINGVLQEGLGVETTIDICKSRYGESLKIECKEDADALVILTRFCPSVRLESIHFYEDYEGDMGADGWRALGKALSQLHEKVARFDSYKSQMGDAKMEDVKVIWDCLSQDWTVSLGEGDDVFYKDTGEDRWLTLEKCLSMTDDEWWFLTESDSEVHYWSNVDLREPQEQWLVDMKEAVRERARRGIKADNVTGR